LRLSPRTLQRQLAQHGASYSALLDDVRRGLAMKYIGDAALSIGEIGYLLHFSDATAFHRAFRRWTGEAPVHYRSKLFGTQTGRSAP
jgi:AraC-like DNA-binding protein